MEKFDIGKLLRGFNIFNGANFGKIIYYLVISGVAGLILWAALIRPHTIDKTTQNAENITNITQTKEATALKLKIFGVWIGCGIE